MNAETPSGPVRAKAILVDPTDMSVVWMNESAAHDVAGSAGEPPLSLDDAMPLAQTLDLAEALASVVQSGEAQHRRTNLVSTSKGSLAIATSVYALPDGMLLVITENAWQADRAGKTPGEPGGRRRR